MCGPKIEIENETQSSEPEQKPPVVETKPSVSEALRAGADWLASHPGQWVTGAYQIRSKYDASKGEYVQIPVQCCAIGAIREATGRTDHELEDKIGACAKRELPPQIDYFGREQRVGLIAYNDNVAKDVDQVIGAMRYLAYKCADEEKKLFEGAAL